MIEITGDFWEAAPRFDAACITTNGAVKKNGACVMGAGIAKQAKERYLGIEQTLGRYVKYYGNDVWMLIREDNLLSFPVKHHWKQKADPKLIRKSARELLVVTQVMDWDRVLSVRPGCGNGGLQWSEVFDILDPLWDDRFYIIERES